MSDIKISFKMRMLTKLLFLTGLLTAVFNVQLIAQGHDTPGGVVYVYDQSQKENDPFVIERKIDEGEYTTQARKHSDKSNKATWIYIPGDILKNDLNKNFFLIGFYDKYSVFTKTAENWKEEGSGGTFMKKDEISEQFAINAYRLFTDTSDISDAYLIKCEKYTDLAFCMIEGQLLSKLELESWNKKFIESNQAKSRMFIPFWGVFILTLVLFIYRYIITKEAAYLIYILGNLFFAMGSLSLYFITSYNIQNYPFNDPEIAIILSNPFSIIGIALFILSFIYFYTDRTVLINFSRKFAISISIGLMILACLIAIANYLYIDKMYIFNKVAYCTVLITVLAIYLYINRNNKELKRTKKGTPYLIIVNGSFFLSVSAVIGGILTLVYASNNSLYFGNYEILSFSLTIGASFFSVFTLLAFMRRDELMAQEIFDLKLLATKNENVILQNSLNPHFIFNSLNLIDFFIHKNNYQKARASLQQFRSLLSMVINLSRKKIISLKDELKITELYLQLELTRKEGFFTYQIIVDQKLDIETIYVPVLLIQPLVENSIKHGIFNLTDRKGKIEIVCEKEDDYVAILVRDNGMGFNNSVRKVAINDNRKHFGIDLTRKRLELYSKKCIFGTCNIEEGGSIVSIKIPL